MTSRLFDAYLEIKTENCGLAHVVCCFYMGVVVSLE